MELNVAILHDNENWSTNYGAIFYKGITEDELQAEINRTKDDFMSIGFDCWCIADVIDTMHSNGIDCFVVSLGDVSI